MGTRVQRTLFDDLDNSTDRVGTYRFALEGVEYEIDLTEGNRNALRAALAPFITAGRRLPKTKTPSQRRPDPSDSPRIRAWWAANQQRLNLPPHRTHGVIPRQVRDAYHAAH